MNSAKTRQTERLVANTARRAEVAAAVAVGAPEWIEMEGTRYVTFDNAAGTLPINFFAATV
jgi:hypothetical protein